MRGVYRRPWRGYYGRRRPLPPGKAGPPTLGRVVSTGTARPLTVSTVTNVALGRVTSTGVARPVSATAGGGIPAMPQLIVEVAFSTGADIGNLLQLDDPTRGKLDTGELGGTLSGVPVWTDVTEWVRSGKVTRGSQRVDSPVVTYEAGTCEILLVNADRRFDPSNLDGPYTQETDEVSGESTVLNDNPDFESGTTGWTGWGCTFTQANDQVYSGSWSGKLVPTGTDMFVSIDSDPVAITPGDTYTGRARVRCAEARSILIKIDWFDEAGGIPMSSAFSAYIPLQADTWTLINFSAVAPEGAVTATFVPLMDNTPDASHVLWVDEAELAHMPYRRATQVTAMRAVRVRALWDNVYHELFRGYADEWDVTWFEPDYSETTLTATDAFKVLTGVDRTAVSPSVGGGEDSGARVTRILNSVDWPLPDRMVAAGDSTLQATDLSGDALSELKLAANSEIGELYVDGGGRVVFRNRQALITESRSTTSQATFGDGGGDEMPYVDLGIESDDATFFNEVPVTRPGGTEQVAEDLASQAQFYKRTFRPPAEPILETDNAALNYAYWLLYVASEPEIRFTDITLSPRSDSSTLFPHALGRELGDRITVMRRPPGGGDPINKDQFIRSVEHTFAPAEWRTVWGLQDASRYGSFFVLDHPVLGQLDQNAMAF